MDPKHTSTDLRGEICTEQHCDERWKFEIQVYGLTNGLETGPENRIEEGLVITIDQINSSDKEMKKGYTTYLPNICTRARASGSGQRLSAALDTPQATNE